jgi:DNA-binding MarR family transcriptional regulator
MTEPAERRSPRRARPGRSCDDEAVSAEPDPATSAWQAMRTLVLDLHDRRVAVAEATGMSYMRSKALRRLTGGAMPMRELGAALLTDAPYITVIVDDLEQRGLVQRQANPADRRSKLVSITPAGRAAARLADEIQSAPPAPLAALGEAELTALERTLRRLVDSSD